MNSKEERETLISFTEQDRIDGVFSVFTEDQVIVRRLKKMGVEPNRVDTFGGHFYKSISFDEVNVLTKKRKQNLSDEQRKIRAERLAKARNAS